MFDIETSTLEADLAATTTVTDSPELAEAADSVLTTLPAQVDSTAVLELLDANAGSSDAAHTVSVRAHQLLESPTINCMEDIDAPTLLEIRARVREGARAKVANAAEGEWLQGCA